MAVPQYRILMRPCPGRDAPGDATAPKFEPLFGPGASPSPGRLGRFPPQPPVQDERQGALAQDEPPPPATSSMSNVSNESACSDDSGGSPAAAAGSDSGGSTVASPTARATIPRAMASLISAEEEHPAGEPRAFVPTAKKQGGDRLPFQEGRTPLRKEADCFVPGRLKDSAGTRADAAGSDCSDGGSTSASATIRPMDPVATEPPTCKDPPEAEQLTGEREASAPQAAGTGSVEKRADGDAPPARPVHPPPLKRTPLRKEADFYRPRRFSMDVAPAS